MHNNTAKKNLPICITGGSGFVGRHLVRQLLKEGLGPISIVDHNPPEKTVAKDVRFFKANFSDERILEKAISLGGIVIHLAGTSNQATAENDPVRDADISVLGTLKLLEVATRKKISKIIFASSGPAVYGSAKKLPAEVDTLPRPRSVYGITKLAIEHYLRHHAEKHGFTYVILRCVNAYGPGQLAKTHGVVSKFALNILSGKPIEIWGSPKVKRDFIYVKDLVSAIIAAMQPNVRNATLNVGSGKGSSLGELIKAVEKSSGVKAKVVIKEQRFIDVPDLYFAIGRSKKILHWRPKTSLVVGVKYTMEWIKDQAS